MGSSEFPQPHEDSVIGRTSPSSSAAETVHAVNDTILAPSHWRAISWTEEDGPEVDAVARDEAPCVQYMCTIGADCGMECACNACRDDVTQVQVLKRMRNVAELCGEVTRIEDYLSGVASTNAHPVEVESFDYLLNLVGYKLRSGPSITVGEYAVRQGVVFADAVMCIPCKGHGGRSEDGWIRGLSFSRRLAPMKKIRGTI